MKDTLKKHCKTSVTALITCLYSSFIAHFFVYSVVWEQKSFGIVAGLLLTPPTLAFLSFFHKRKVISILIYWLSIAILLFALHLYSNHKQTFLYSVNHTIQQDNDPKLNDNELELLREVGDAQLAFLHSCQLLSNVMASSILVFIFNLIYLSTRKKYSIPIIITTPILGLVLLCFIPCNPEGQWSDGMLGCMTSAYHYLDIKNNKVTEYNICGSICTEGKITDRGYIVKQGEKYIWEIPSPKPDKPIRYEFQGTWFRLKAKCLDENITYKFFGIRNIDYYTQNKFRDYLERIILKNETVAK